MIIIIVGPTAVGKTKLSVELAKYLNGEIINADSTQVYKGMDIATAKVTEEEKENVPHHLFDIKNINEFYTVYNYQIDCRNKIKEIEEKGKTPVIVGGTGLYLKAALYDYNFDIEETHPSYQGTNDELYQQLLKVDPNTLIHPNNRKRIERALSYYQEHKKPISEKEISQTLLYPCLIIGLTTERETLYDRINKRVDSMVQNGLLEEAKKIYQTNIRTKAVLTPIGYKELFPYFENKITLEDALEAIKTNSRHYAKKQYTWFNHQMNVTWFNVNFDNFDETVNEVINYIKQNQK